MSSPKSALVFGASGEQGRAVIEGLVLRSDLYSPVYAFSRETTDTYLTDALGVNLITGNIANPDDVEKALRTSGTNYIFLVTTTDLPTEANQTTSFWQSYEDEYMVIMEFFNRSNKFKKKLSNLLAECTSKFKN